MDKLKFALIGHNISHSISHTIHRNFFKISRTDASYELQEIPVTNFQKDIEYVFKNFTGFNITSPFKQLIIPHLKQLDESAAVSLSVNTVNCATITGYNTDSKGFTLSLFHNQVKLCGKIAILGCGGVARTIAFEAAKANCSIVIAVRKQSLQRARKLCSDIKSHFSHISASACTVDDICERTDILVNATPVGMYPNINDTINVQNILKNCLCVFDCIYNPPQTLLLKMAEKCGIRTINGLYMLIVQAALAHRIWYGKVFTKEEITHIYKLAEDELENFSEDNGFV